MDGSSAIWRLRKELVHASLRDLWAALIFRYIGGVGAGVLFHLLGDRLPFPRHELVVLCAILVGYNTLLLPALLFADRLPRVLLYLVPAFCDLAVTFGFVHLTGGFLSPFLFAPLLTVIGINIAYLTDRRASISSFAFLASTLVAMTVAHRTELLPCPVPYAARLIRDDAFFYATFPPVLLLFTFGWLLARSTGGSIYVTITDLLATNQKLLERLAVASEVDGRRDFLRMVAESFAGDYAFLIPTSNSSAPASLFDVWPQSVPQDLKTSLRDMAPVQCALETGECLVAYGAQQQFSECPVLHRTDTDGCWIVVLRDEVHTPIGLLGVLCRGAVQLNHKSEFLMKLFTVLAQADLQRRMAEQATDAIREQLHHSRKMEALGQLAGGVAHDFNNLLAVVIGASELLVARLGDRPELAGYARDILLTGHRAADLVRHMLSFARQRPQEVAPVNLHASLLEVERLLTHTLDKRVEVSIDAAAEFATVLGDASQIQNALLNVALNARDAMPDGGRLEFETANRELGAADVAACSPGVKPGRHVEILCRDTGVGMARDVLERAFEPFFTTKGPGKGTGLGLAAVYGIVQAHGGFVEIESALGVGTTVRIVLPATQAPEVPRTVCRPRLTPVSAAPARVLVAEDEVLVAGVIKTALRRAGYEVEVESNGAAAVERYRLDPERYDLVLLDVMMPRLDGRQAFDAMQRMNPGVRCVFVSGFSDEERIGPLLAAGRCGFVQKPFVLDRLLEAVRAELDTPRGRQRCRDAPSPPVAQGCVNPRARPN